MRSPLRSILLGVVICLATVGFGRSFGPGGPGSGGSDTVSAMVVYGEHHLFDRHEALSDDQLAVMIDSLLELEYIDADLIKEINLYRSIRNMDELQMVSLIDSLFELDTIPYALINEVNLYLSSMPTQEMVDRSLIVPWTSSAPFPAHDVYGKWVTTTPNAYGQELSKNDSTLMVKLVEPELDCGFHMPITGVVTSKFGWRDGRNHNGMDIDLEVWDPVHAAFPGKVRYVGYAGGFGRLVVVRHFNGLETFYAHLHRYKVRVGDEVEAGTVVGLGGSSGHSSGSHLHFEVRFKGVPIDPSHLISFKEEMLVCDTLVLNKTRWSYASYPLGTKFHTVQKGDHLYGIAEQYGTSIGRLCDLNGITKKNLLRVGQQLLVSAP